MLARVVTIYPVPKPRPKRKPVGTSKTRLQRTSRLQCGGPMKKFNKKRGGHMFPKNVDEPYREWIRALPCLLTSGLLWARGALASSCPVGDWGVIDAAHVKTKGSGGKDRNNIVPLCHYHHMEQHDIGIRTFQCRYGVDLKTRARQLTEIYEAEKFPCP